MQLHAVAVFGAQLSALSTIEGLMIDITVTCSPHFVALRFIALPLVSPKVCVFVKNLYFTYLKTY